ncbi:MAG TPA: cytochrome c maturation protein CcmE [Chitinophagales bacterium]|nr:cytochrome c maturation protein CcmE [Chitinophagales bacterium]
MKKSHIIALLLIVISMSVIISMIGDYSRYETFATAESSGGREFHIVGQLVRQDEMEYNPEKDPNYFSFYLKDKAGEERKVVFRDTKPTDFERSEQIVLTGKMVGNEFHASKILMKCPSKYINNELEVKEVTAGT